MTARRSMLVRVGVVVWVALLAACAPPAPAPMPDPVIVCAAAGGTVTATPPATDGVGDVTVQFGPDWSLSGCTDRTGAGVTTASFELTSLRLTDFVCTPPAGTPWGTGGGQLRWSNQGTSQFDASLLAGGPSGGLGTLELTLTAGQWAGARTTIPMRIVSADGDCVTTPMSEVLIAASDTVVFRPPLPPAIADIVQVAAGTSHTCALTEQGTVKCWGDNSYGQLGDGAPLPGPGSAATGTDLPHDVPGIDGAVAVTAGEFHSCALLGDGSVRCWGYGGRGELGTGDTASSSTPVAVVGIDDATDISQGAAHTCVLITGGTAKCWGYNFWGSLGDGSNTNRSLAVDVVGLSDAISIHAGGDSTCALGADGAPRCWGQNQAGQLGDGTNSDRTTPVPVLGLGLSTVTGMALGRYHSCASLSDGSVRCWGANNSGQLGDGSEVASTIPVPVVGIDDATALGAGYSHSCAALSDGSINCWGQNDEGQLGDGSNAASSTPVPVIGIDDATTLSASLHTCVRRDGGMLDCWGRGLLGQLGDGTSVSRNTPAPVRSYD